MIADRLQAVTQRIAKCCEKSGRSPDDVCLVCVTKGVEAGVIREALAAGVQVLGENRVQDAAVKHCLIGDTASWHMVGHLQTNKVRDAVRIFSLIHSVDSLHLAEAIDKEAARVRKVQDILIQVNVSGEESKFGIPPDQVFPFIKEAGLLPHVAIRGLMTIAPESADPDAARPHFRRLYELQDEINERRLVMDELTILSMGMSDDFEVAIEEGSTMVRIGRAIFGEKEQPGSGGQ